MVSFRIRYWGITGGLTAPLRPEQVTAKITRAVQTLAQKGVLRELEALANDSARLQMFLEDQLPFHLRSTYGGNTTCIEIETPEGLIILDSGSGFRELGIALSKRWNEPGYTGERAAQVLITHAHMDHTYATPFFDPYYDPRNSFILWGTKHVMDSLDAVLSPESHLHGTYFPPGFDVMAGISGKQVIEPGKQYHIGKTLVSTFALNHPGGAVAYRMERDGRAVVIATDHEHREAPDKELAEFASGADLMYVDAQYESQEYLGKIGIAGEPPMPRTGWGHSTYEDFVATAIEARVRRLHLGHREPKRDDEGIGHIETAARNLFDEITRQKRLKLDCSICVAYEGLEVHL